MGCVGHGTHVSGLIVSRTYGVAPNPLTKLYSVKILNCFGSGDTASLAAGLLHVLNNYQTPAILNLSVGMSGIDATLRSLITDLISRGVVVVGAAGNQMDDACRYFPAGVSGVVAVAALAQTSDNSDQAASYSNYGSCIDIFAPGSSVQSTLPNGLTGFKSGTSMACPVVTGSIALKLASDLSLTSATAASLIQSSATQGVVTASNPSVRNNVVYVTPVEVPTPAPTPPPPPPTPAPTPSPSTSTTFASSTTGAASTTQSAATTTASAASTTSIAATTTSSRATTTGAALTTTYAVATATASMATTTAAATSSGSPSISTGTPWTPTSSASRNLWRLNESLLVFVMMIIVLLLIL